MKDIKINCFVDPIGLKEEKKEIIKMNIRWCNIMDMAKKLDYLDNFIKRMKEKIIETSVKHNDKDIFKLEDAVDHLICEIYELFNIGDYYKSYITNLFKSKKIKPDELIDIANMCWIIDYLINLEKYE